MNGVKQISLLIIFSLIFPAQVFASGASGISAAVVPVYNGVNDQETKVLSDQLANLLGAFPGLKIIDSKKVSNILKYQERPDVVDSSRLKAELARAKENYYQLNYIGAKSAVKDVIAKFNGDIAKNCDDGEILRDAYVTLGIINQSMGNTVEARQAFREAIRMDPNYNLDGRAFSPSLIDAFADEKRSSEALPKGSVKISADIKVAEVYINGILKGVTPLEIKDLPAGQHYLKISSNKYDAVRKMINVVAGKDLKIKEHLSWQNNNTAEDHITSASNEVQQIEAGLRIADTLKVDKVVMISTVDRDLEARDLTAKIVDAKYRTGLKSINISYNKKDAGPAATKISKVIASRINSDIANDPQRLASPVGLGSPTLMASKKKSGISKPVLYGILGGLLAVGLGGGLAIAFSGSSAGSGNVGGLNINFR